MVQVPTQRGRNVTCVAAISASAGIIHKMVHIGLVNGETCHGFVEALMAILPNEPMNLIMDNVRIHHFSRVQELVTGTQYTLLYLPPYSPFLNPIEECFSKWKGLVRRTPLENRETLIARIEEASLAITPADCNNWVNHSVFSLVYQL